MIASPFFAPCAGIVATGAGASEPPRLLSTTTSLPVEMNEYLPSAVIATPNGLPPTDAFCVRTPDICLALGAAVVHPGGLTAAVSVPPPPPDPVPPWCSAVNAATTTAITTTAAAVDMKARERHHGSPGIGWATAP